MGLQRTPMKKTARFLAETFKINMKRISPMFLLVIMLFMGSCQKDQIFGFAKSTGKIVTITRSTDNNFTNISVNDNVNLIITQGNTYSIKLEGGENLLPGITTSISDSLLTIKNTNTFNWMRSYDLEITAYVTLPHIFLLQYEATSRVTNVDTIREDSLTISATGGSGYIDLNIKTGTSKLSIINGSVDMKIQGTTGVNFIYSGGYGPFRCTDLKSDFLFMRNASTNDCYVTVKKHFEYEITSLGNIYYSGNPPELSGTITGQGKLVKYD
jgi:hypothetical protein